jgi:hypothetical protein
MHSKSLLLSWIVVLFFTACGSKQYYTPKNISSGVSTTSSEEIVNFNRVGATLENGRVLTRRGELKLKLKDGYKFINSNSKGVITSNKDGKCIVMKNGKTQAIKFPKELIAGTIIGNSLVYIFRDNNFGIYDLSKKSIIYNEKGEKVFSIDTRVVNPIQVERLVVVPLLNGKLVVLDFKAHKVVKEILVTTESSLNNIIFLKRFKDTLIAATPYKVISVDNQGKRELKRDISEIVMDDNSIFVFSKDGKISKLDETLTVQDEKKFKFAHFSVATVYKDKVYALDKQGYLIVSNKDFTKHKVYEFPEVDGYSFVSGGYIYYDGEKIDLNSLNYE